MLRLYMIIYFPGWFSYCQIYHFVPKHFVRYQKCIYASVFLAYSQIQSCEFTCLENTLVPKYGPWAVQTKTDILVKMIVPVTEFRFYIN